MIELSGSDDRRNVSIIGATNRPEVMDRALFRNGRFGKLVHVTLPNAEERGSILTALARKRKIDASVNLTAFGRDEACKNLSGSDLNFLLNIASTLASEEELAAMLAAEERHAALVRKRTIYAIVDLIAIAREEASKDLSGADISKLLNHARVLAAGERHSAERSSSVVTTKKKHHELALKYIRPTVSEEEKQHYYCFEQKH